VHWVRYERLRENPSEVVEELAEILNLTVNDCVREFLQENPRSRTTISEPEKEKWRRKNEEEVLSVIDKVIGTSRKIGYEV
jgi:DNA-binding transcriptional regulator YhcF (GntR family)